MLPTSVHVGTGIIIDSYGNESNQTDLIVTHRGKQPALLAQTTEVLHPIETVLLAIEVKTTVAERDVNDFADKKRAHDQLRLRTSGHTAPLAFFGFSSSVLPITTAKYFHDLEADLRPDFLTIVNPGIYGERLNDDSFVVGLTPRHNGNDWDYAAKEDRTKATFRDNVSYPVSRIAGQTSARVVTEPSRALLLFCATVLRHLAVSEATDSSWIGHYMTPKARSGISYSPGPGVGLSYKLHHKF